MMFVRLCVLCFVLLILSPLASLMAQEKPDQEKSLSAPLSELERKIEAALARKVNWNYSGTRLEELVADLSKQTGLPIGLDPEGLEEAGVTPQTQITLDVGELSLRQGLRLLEAWNLSYVPSASGLVITSEQVMYDGDQLVRIYPVRDLIRIPADKHAEVLDDYDALIELITSHLLPDSWVDNGGRGSISGFAGCLVIAQSFDQHHEVANLLSMLREAKRDPKSTAMLAPANRKRVIEALNKRDSAAIDTSLERYARDLAKRTGIPVHLDPAGLEDTGITPEQVTQAEYHEARLGDACREILAKYHLAPVALEGCLLITSEEKAWDIGQTTRLYPIGDLLDASEQAPMPGDPWDDALVELISNSSEPDAWIDNGGPSSISIFANPPVLVVTTTDEIHESVQNTLAKIREAGAADYVKENAKTANRIVERVYPLYAARRALRAQIELGKPAAEKPQEKKSDAVSAPDAKPMPQFGGPGLIGFLRPQVAEPIPSAEEVAKLIEELLPDPSWKAEGVVLKPFHDVLIIRQSPAMLRKVEALLMKIDAIDSLPRGLGGGLGSGGGGFGGGMGGGGGGGFF